MYFLLILALLFSHSLSFAQVKKRQLRINRTVVAPVIDGKLDDETWKTAAMADSFIQYVPYNKEPSKERSIVKIVYDDNSLYIGAMLYDSKPDSIFSIISARDGGYDDEADVFMAAINPFNDGINTNVFGVSAAGVQSDIKGTSIDDDSSWDAVWKSEVNLVDSGWIVEMEIPYSELRFSKNANQVWGFNLYRRNTRLNEWSSWNYLNNKIEGVYNQSGELTGLTNLKPPLRLSFTPYLSLYAENNFEENVWIRGVRGGLDLKYGINESFTLDMMLIPDFAQVQSDDQVLNLSPFEVQYQERRPFFTEGTELFSKGEVFYSKRIGGKPRDYDNVEDEITDNEEINENPFETQIINATKITGRTKKGLGIGFFNAMTLQSVAKIKDSVNNSEREYVTQPFTNYNILVFDQNLKNNSYISLINTNMIMPDRNYTSNVSALDFRVKNKNQTYEVRGKCGMSQIYDNENESDYGYWYSLHFEKTAGNFLFELSNAIIDDKYNPNDLGYLSHNNYVENKIEMDYRILKPTWKFVEFGSELEITHVSRYAPFDYISVEYEFDTYITFRNYWTWGFFIGGKPFESNDFYEPRVDDRVYKLPAEMYVGTFLNSDRRKKIYFNSTYVHWNSFSDYGQEMHRVEFFPTWRASDKFKLGVGAWLEFLHNSLGYVSDEMDDVFFGRRERRTYELSLNAGFTFNAKSQIALRARHYWSSAKYHQYYILNQEGRLNDYAAYTENEDINFNAFNIDMVYNWRFAPGSEFLVIWKMQYTAKVMM
ncbi:MAG: carbohydrate binding family 9 domain-containing protein [Chloroflexia bacterium]|nr:carbohydrate binding family 9 domain-containing protein [Chloroflexia bacterium]